MLRRVGLSQAETGTYRQEAKQADGPARDLDARHCSCGRGEVVLARHLSLATCHSSLPSWPWSSFWFY